MSDEYDIPLAKALGFFRGYENKQPIIDLDDTHIFCPEHVKGTSIVILRPHTYVDENRLVRRYPNETIGTCRKCGASIVYEGSTGKLTVTTNDGNTYEVSHDYWELRRMN